MFRYLGNNSAAGLIETGGALALLVSGKSKVNCTKNQVFFRRFAPGLIDQLYI